MISLSCWPAAFEATRFYNVSENSPLARELCDGPTCNEVESSASQWVGKLHQSQADFFWKTEPTDILSRSSELKITFRKTLCFTICVSGSFTKVCGIAVLNLGQPNAPM